MAKFREQNMATGIFTISEKRVIQPPVTALYSACTEITLQ